MTINSYTMLKYVKKMNSASCGETCFDAAQDLFLKQLNDQKLWNYFPSDITGRGLYQHKKNNLMYIEKFCITRNQGKPNHMISMMDFNNNWLLIISNDREDTSSTSRISKELTHRLMRNYPNGFKQRTFQRAAERHDII